ncbi:MAG: MBL fold metallo-hydrolase [Deltaproteobacteria bacterium]|nr:MBL fold metallo-hydrolase [Deltaproteobacteria bacterium]
MPVHLISGGYANTYVIEDGNSFVAVDVGTSKAAEKIYQYLSVYGGSINTFSLRMVTATHFHIDHVAGISSLVELFPKIRVCFFNMVGDYLNGKDKICLFSPSAWLKGLLPVVIALDNHIKNTIAALFSGKGAIPLPFLRTKFFPSDYSAECILDEDQPIPYLPHWVILKTPGHTNDSVCFYNNNEKSIISGDTILNMKGSGELNNFCCNQNAIKGSFKKLLPLDVKNIYPGHGKPLCNLDGLGNVTQ